MVAARIMRAFGAGKGEIVVLNDEAHHCYQDKLLDIRTTRRTARIGSATATPGSGSAACATCAAGPGSRPSTTCRRPRTT